MSQNAATVALINRLKFKHLALLVALDDTRNVHQAADAINVAQPKFFNDGGIFDKIYQAQ